MRQMTATQSFRQARSEFTANRMIADTPYTPVSTWSAGVEAQEIKAREAARAAFQNFMVMVGATIVLGVMLLMGVFA